MAYTLLNTTDIEIEMNLLLKENINIYLYDREEIIDRANSNAYLSDDEMHRAEAFVFDDDKKWFRACRITLREVLANTLTILPEEVKFQYGEKGKPFLAKENKSLLQFNLAHTKDKLIIVTHPFKMLGVDIEKLQKHDNDAIVERFFHQDEVSVYSGLNEAEKVNAFYHLWVIKEAIAKAKGMSLYQIMDKISVKNFIEGIDMTVEGMLNLHLELLPMPQGYYAAVCVLDE